MKSQSPFKQHFQSKWWLLSAFLFLTGCGGTDLTVGTIIVNQAVQTSTNSVALIANRGTVVRVMVGTGTATVNNVTGKLHVLVNGTEITPAAGLDPLSPITAAPSPDLNNENSTLNFELPSPSGITASNDVDFHVDITPVTGESNTGNNHGELNDVHFISLVNPTLFFTRIDYTPAGAGLPALSDVQAGTGDAFVKGIFPFNDSDPNLYRQGLFPTLPYGEDANGDGILDAYGSDGNDLLAFLSSCRQLIISNGLGLASNTFLYGWIKNNPIDGNGLSELPGFDAFGNTDPIRGQRSYAHELTHNFGRYHNTETLSPNTGWDVGARLQNNPAANNTTGHVKPGSLNDIMVAGLLTNQAWVDVNTYNAYLANPAVDASSSGPDAQKNLQAKVAVIQGLFDTAGLKLIRIEPVFRYAWPSQPTAPRESGDYQIVVTDNAGASTMNFTNAMVCGDGKNQMAHHGFFEVRVPVNPNIEIQSVSVINTKSKQVMGELKSSKPPTITVTAPAPKSKLDSSTTVKWTVKDPDTAPDNLMFNIAYSSDGGQTWVPVGVRVKGTSFTFPSNQIQATRESNGMIRVYVSDGLNTAYGDVTGLSTTAAQYK